MKEEVLKTYFESIVEHLSKVIGYLDCDIDNQKENRYLKKLCSSEDKKNLSTVIENNKVLK